MLAQQVLMIYIFLDVTLDFLKKNIKENEQRKYLLDAKKDQLEVQKKEAEDALTKLKNITPVERDESTSPRDITVSYYSIL